MAFEALRDRRITTQQLVPVSPRTAAMQPTKLGLMPGTRLTVEEAILGLVTKSANDAAAALGELLGGSEDRFAQMMTLRARALGMSRTTFTNASGLPDPDAVDHGARPGDPGAAPADGLPRVLSLFQHAQLHLPEPRDLQPRPHAAVLSRRRRHEDRLHRGVWAQSGHQRRAQRRSPDRRRAGRRLQPRARRAHGDAAGPGLRADGRAARAPYHGGEPDAQPGRHRACRDIGDAADPSGRATRRTTAAWTIQVGSFGSERRRATPRRVPAARPTAARCGSNPPASAARTIWRAQVIGLTPAEAQGACAALARHRSACTVLRPDQRQVASG